MVTGVAKKVTQFVILDLLFNRVRKLRGSTYLYVI